MPVKYSMLMLLLLLFVRYLCLILKLKHEALIDYDKNVKFTINKPVFNIVCKIKYA